MSSLLRCKKAEKKNKAAKSTLQASQNQKKAYETKKNVFKPLGVNFSFTTD